MGKYNVYTDDSEVIGQSILSTVECLAADMVRPHLEKNGLASVELDQWYPLQTWFDVFNDVEQDPDNMMNLVSIGMKIVETAVLPPEFDTMSFSEIINMIDAAYKMNNRGTDIGAYAGEIVGERHIKVVITAPYPDHYSYGVIYGFAQRYLSDYRFNVHYQKDTPRREEGGEATIVHVEW